MRARTPDHSGFAARDGVKLAYEVFDDPAADPGRPTVLLAPTWSIIHSRFWKAQVPYLARHHRVVTFDGRGSGRSDKPAGAPAHTPAQYAADIVAVLDATGTDRAVVVGLSAGAWASVVAAADHPGRIAGLVLIGSSCGIPADRAQTTAAVWDQRLPTTDGWSKYNRYHWLEGGYEDFARFFFAQMFCEPHSSKAIEDAVGWALENDPATVVDTTAGRQGLDGAVVPPVEEACARLRCPVLVVHGDDDRISPPAAAERLAELTGGSLVTLIGAGHGPMARDPVQVNHLVRRFVDQVHPPRPRRTTWTRAARRPAAPSTCRRPSAWATPGATWPSPPSCAASSPTWRSTGWPSTRSPPCWSRPASRSTRPPRGSPTSRPTSRTSARSTTSTPSRPSAGWTRSSSTTSWCSATSSSSSTTTS